MPGAPTMGIATSLRRRRSSARHGSTRRWRRIREVVFARDGHTCATCGRYGNHIDHITPVALGGGDELANLRVRCAACNVADGRALAGIGRRRQGSRTEPRVYPGAIDLED